MLQSLVGPLGVGLWVGPTVATMQPSPTARMKLLKKNKTKYSDGDGTLGPKTPRVYPHIYAQTLKTPDTQAALRDKEGRKYF